jgi:hypothetical protein
MDKPILRIVEHPDFDTKGAPLDDKTKRLTESELDNNFIKLWEKIGLYIHEFTITRENISQIIGTGGYTDPGLLALEAEPDMLPMIVGPITLTKNTPEELFDSNIYGEGSGIWGSPTVYIKYGAPENILGSSNIAWQYYYDFNLGGNTTNSLFNWVQRTLNQITVIAFYAGADGANSSYPWRYGILQESNPAWINRNIYLLADSTTSNFPPLEEMNEDWSATLRFAYFNIPIGGGMVSQPV